MPKFIKITTLIAIFISISFCMNAQSALNSKKLEWNGSNISFGAHQSTFLTSRFSQNISGDVLGKKIGSSIEYYYVGFPFIFNANFFISKFKVAENTVGFPYGEGVDIKHRGIEVGAAIGFLPEINWTTPFIGIGYQSASLGTGLGVDSIVDDAGDAVEVSSTNVSQPIVRLGTIIKIDNFGAILEFKRSLNIENNELPFNQISVRFSASSN